MKWRTYIYCVIAFAMIYYSNANERIINLGDEFTENIAQFSNNSQENIEISFKLLVHNLTLFDLKYFSINEKNYYNFKNVNDSIISFEYSDKINSSLVNLYFTGVTLTGNDSIFQLSIVDLNINNVKYKNNTFTYKVLSDYNALPYIKFPEIINVYPNPIEYSNEIYCEFSIDYFDSLKISVYDLCGRELIIQKLVNDKKGKVTFKILLDEDLIPGVYYLVIKDKFGYHSKKFEIVK